ncbi:PREDICTED: uncharacterized protein LOC109173067 [Ipomoea nil]|uniref:uncharacterized protein LOC109173067 n=1 Tax=Ipomoea nil TaxID=35883 RepID=UPI00090147BB|nr:PREDICTED: uncharacterized protein LOC109173067 [Ipomoea nil]
MVAVRRNGAMVETPDEIFYSWMFVSFSNSYYKIKFEKGYNIESIFEENKLGVEPYSVEVSLAVEVFILDSENNNIYKITTPHSVLFAIANSRPMLAVGSPEGCSGHVDGKLREARMNHPKGLAMDDSGNMYVIDAMPREDDATFPAWTY